MGALYELFMPLWPGHLVASSMVLWTLLDHPTTPDTITNASNYTIKILEQQTL